MTINFLKRYGFILFFVAGNLFSCKKEKNTQPVANPLTPPSTIPEFYKSDANKVSPNFTVLGTSSNNLNKPYDLDFNPGKQNELWVVNYATEAMGGSTVIYSNAGLSNQTSVYKKDGNSWHFMSLPTALAFGDNGNFSTSPGVLDANHDGGNFTGPALWPGDLSIYAITPPGGNGSHLDMLHESPYSMGVAYEKDNIYWVFDGYYGNICRYDFEDDHGPGNDDHSNGKIRRYKEVTVLKKSGVPSHMILDKATGWLYICDTGNKRVIRLDTKIAGTKTKDLTPSEPVAEYWEMQGVTWEVFITQGFQEPSGIEIKNNRLFVGDNSNGDVICFDINSKAELGRVSTGSKGVKGIKIAADGKLWFVNSVKNELYRMDPK